MSFESHESIFALEKGEVLVAEEFEATRRSPSGTRTLRKRPPPAPLPFGMKKSFNRIAALGPAPGARKPNPRMFHTKSTSELPPPTNFTYPDRLAGTSREAVPRAAETLAATRSLAQSGTLRSSGGKTRNFVKENVIDVVRSQPGRPGRRIPRPDAEDLGVDWTARPEFGSVPAYLSMVKQQVAEDQEYIAELERIDAEEAAALAAGPGGLVAELDEAERQRIVRSLKNRWTRLEQEYSSMSFRHGTLKAVDRKLQLEEELDDVERLVDALSQPTKIVS